MTTNGNLVETEADAPAFPAQSDTAWFTGMSFRDYLVGQLLTGLAATERKPDYLVDKAISMANMAITKLYPLKTEDPNG